MHFILFVIALIAGGGGDLSENGPGSSPAVGLESEAPVESADALTAEPQTPTGRFTTATEVRPILDATKANWVAVREFDGRDLVYFTHLLAWRCGLVQLEYGINGGAMEQFPLPACHEDTATPNALLPEDELPYVGFGLGTVETVEVRITYDDLGTDGISVDRRGVLIP